jgi:hypothetical protein
VSSWTDFSGNGFHATQATGTAQPTFQTNEINGLPIVRFDGTDSLASTAPTNGAAQTIFTVIKQANLTGTHTIRGASLPDGSGLQHHTRTSGKQCLVQLNIAVLGTATTSLVAGTATILSSSFSDATDAVAFYFNGAADGTATTTVTLGAGSTTLIGAHPELAESLFGDIGELIVYTRLLTTTERGQVHSYLNDKWGIAVADYIPSPALIPVQNPARMRAAIF